jgi:hypothetical protein
MSSIGLAAMDGHDNIHQCTRKIAMTHADGDFSIAGRTNN